MKVKRTSLTLFLFCLLAAVSILFVSYLDTVMAIPSQYTLSVSKTGSGTVSSVLSGIDCGSTCSAKYDSGTSVTLTANPASLE